ncbi:unnamed protein product, partial [Discosporangium mesarthrocarpum]
ILLPLFGDDEQEWPKPFRAILYLLGLMWAFIGVSIVSDVFMSAIEVITSQEKTIKLENGATVNVKSYQAHHPDESNQQFTIALPWKIWNATVANLTLMALGSSAPEILLSVIEIVSDNYFSGELGPSTIVG